MRIIRHFVLLFLVLILLPEVNAQIQLKKIKNASISISNKNNGSPVSLSQNQISSYIKNQDENFTVAKEISLPSNGLSFGLDVYQQFHTSKNLLNECYLFYGSSIHLEQRLAYYQKSEELIREIEKEEPKRVLKEYDRVQIRYFEPINRVEVHTGALIVHHINQKWNIDGSFEVGLGRSLKNQIQVSKEISRELDNITESGTTTSTISNEYSIENLEGNSFWLVQPVLKAGLEYKVFERRLIFIGVNYQAGSSIYFTELSNASEFWNGVSIGIKSSI